MTDQDDLEDIGYADAVAELEEILERLEGDDLDVDVLAAHVERASALIDVCRRRITTARVKIESVVADLESTADAAKEQAEPDEEL